MAVMDHKFTTVSSKAIVDEIFFRKALSEIELITARQAMLIKVRQVMHCRCSEIPKVIEVPKIREIRFREK